MIDGHGDDIRRYEGIKVNFSSNVYNHFNHSGLKAFLKSRLDVVSNYPEPQPQTLERELALDMGMEANEVMVTNGATEAIYLVAQTYHGKKSIIKVPSFAEYADACRSHQHNVLYTKGIPRQMKNELCWLCCPNNPTGAVIPKKELTDILTTNPDTIFVLDASYAPFTSEPLILPKEGLQWPNLIMLHSMTKEYAIPGLRLGYVTANHQLIEQIRKNRMPWSVNALAQEAGCYLLAHKSDYVLDLPMLLSERERIAKAFEKTQSIKTYQSDSHILLCQLKKGTATALKKHLAEQHGLLIRDASNFHGLDERHFRIAVQGPEENTLLINAVKEWIASPHI